MPVALVESEKTAIIASLYFPQFAWLAAGSLTGLSTAKCKILAGRTVVLFPDIGGYEKWSIKAKELSSITKFIVSDLLERNATEEERRLGRDLADYLLKFEPDDFVDSEHQIKTVSIELDKPSEDQFKNSTKETKPIIGDPIELQDAFFEFQSSRPDNWEERVLEMETFFLCAKLPSYPIVLYPHVTIVNIQKMIQGHLAVLKSSARSRLLEPFLKRLFDLKTFMLSSAN